MAHSDDRSGIFAGDDPFAIARAWLAEAEGREPNDPNAMALATVDASGLPDVRVVLLKGIEDGVDDGGGFVFYTNYGSRKSEQLAARPGAALVLHWKSLRRQVRARGPVAREEGPRADAYFASRHPQSRLGAWGSPQSRPIASRQVLVDAVESARAEQGDDPTRPPFWGGWRVTPLEMEFWADGAHRLHDRFRWSRPDPRSPWTVTRLGP